MTKRLDPEIKALRALVRAFGPLSPDQRQRGIEWYVAQQTGRHAVRLPGFRVGVADASPSSEAGRAE